MLPALQRIRLTSEAAVRRYASFAATAVQHPSIKPTTIDFALPLPAPLTPRLVNLGVDEAAAKRIAASLTSVTTQLRDSCLREYRQRCAQFGAQGLSDSDLPSLKTTITTIYTRTVREWTSYLVNDVTPRVTSAQSRRVSHAVGSSQGSIHKTPFNQSAVPLLEQFFEENAFPSRLEKHELASTCGMEYKQIHTWFQNRRSRFRKEGKPLNKLQPDAVLQALEKSVVDTMLPADPGDEDDESALPHNEPCGFNLVGPPHAFPSPYPPVCSYDPFPTTPPKRAFSLPWLRLPTSGRVSNESLDVPALVTAFARLSIVGGSTEPTSSVLRPLPGFITPCAPAPLPALIRRPRRAFRHVYSPSISTSTTAHSSAASTPLQLCGPSVRPASRSSLSPLAIPLCLASRTVTRRTLPRRTPQHPPIVRVRERSSIYKPSDIHLSRSSSNASFVSRTSSYESDPDSPLSTPPPLVIDLPGNPPILHGSSLDSVFLDQLTVEQVLQWTGVYSPSQSDGVKSIVHPAVLSNPVLTS